MFLSAHNFFEKYVHQYNLESEESENSFLQKYHHTHEVVKWMKLFVENESFTDEEKQLAYAVALFHDIGRFVQLKKYYRNNDFFTNFDHAKESIRILQENHWFTSHVNKEEEDIISFAIFYHNKFEVPKKEGFAYDVAHLLRDADKLANLETLVYTDFSGCTLSEEVYKQFLKKTLIKECDVKNDVDELVAKLAWIFDIHYSKSLLFIKEFHLLDRWLLELEKHIEIEKYQNILEILTNYLFS